MSLGARNLKHNPAKSTSLDSANPVRRCARNDNYIPLSAQQREPGLLRVHLAPYSAPSPWGEGRGEGILVQIQPDYSASPKFRKGLPWLARHARQSLPAQPIYRPIHIRFPAKPVSGATISQILASGPRSATGSPNTPSA